MMGSWVAPSEGSSDGSLGLHASAWLGGRCPVTSRAPSMAKRAPRRSNVRGELWEPGRQVEESRHRRRDCCLGSSNSGDVEQSGEMQCQAEFQAVLRGWIAK